MARESQRPGGEKPGQWPLADTRVHQRREKPPAASIASDRQRQNHTAGGRTLSADLLKQTYADVAQQARGMQTRYLPAMQEKARTLDGGQVLALVRGGR